MDDYVKIPKKLLVPKFDVHRNGHGTGDYIDSIDINLGYKRPPRSKFVPRGGFFQGMSNGFLEVAKKGLTQQEYRVLFGAIASMDSGNWVDVTQTVLAEEIGLSQSEVSRALKGLREKGIVIRASHPKKKRLMDRINAVICWMGDTYKGSDFEATYRHDSAILENPAVVIEMDIESH